MGWAGREAPEGGDMVYLATRNGPCQEHRQQLSNKGNRHLPLCRRNQPCAAAAADLQHPLRDFRVDEALCAPGNLMEQVFIR